MTLANISTANIPIAFFIFYHLSPFSSGCHYYFPASLRRLFALHHQTGVFPNLQHAERILEQYEAENINDLRPDLNKLVIYDFKERRIAKEFFQNLKRLLRKVDGFRIQYSVFTTKDMMGAKAVKELARHYGCEGVRIFAVEETE